MPLHRRSGSKQYGWIIPTGSDIEATDKSVASDEEYTKLVSIRSFLIPVKEFELSFTAIAHANKPQCFWTSADVTFCFKDL